jgi:hypothetical protein
MDSLNTELLTVVRETMQPGHASLRLRPDTATAAQHGHSEPEAHGQQR